MIHFPDIEYITTKMQIVKIKKKEFYLHKHTRKVLQKKNSKPFKKEFTSYQNYIVIHTH